MTDFIVPKYSVIETFLTQPNVTIPITDKGQSNSSFLTILFVSFRETADIISNVILVQNIISNDFM